MTRTEVIARVRELGAWGDDDAALREMIEETVEFGEDAATDMPNVRGDWYAALAQCALVLLDEEMAHALG